MHISSILPSIPIAEEGCISDFSTPCATVPPPAIVAATSVCSSRRKFLGLATCPAPSGMRLPAEPKSSSALRGLSELFTVSVNNGTPTLLYLYGAIIVTTSGGHTFGSPIRQAAVPFARPSALAILKGRNRGNASGISWDIGSTVVPGIGTSADCRVSNWPSGTEARRVGPRQRPAPRFR